MKTNRHVWTSLLVGIVIAGGAVASNVTIPNVLQPNTPARASEVNANFGAVKAAVDDNQAQITALGARVGAVEARACPTRHHAATRVGAALHEEAT